MTPRDHMSAMLMMMVMMMIMIRVVMTVTIMVVMTVMNVRTRTCSSWRGEPHVRIIKILSPHYLRHKSFGPSSNLPRNDHRDVKTFHSIEKIVKSQIDCQVMKTFHGTWSSGYEIVSDHLRMRRNYTEPWCLKHKQDWRQKSWCQIIWAGKPLKNKQYWCHNCGVK